MTIVCTNCPMNIRKSYSGKEPSPNGLGVSATYEILGFVTKGRDKKLWQVVSNGNKKRWKLTKRVDTYLTHDNGGRNFAVRVSDTGVFVYTVTVTDDFENDESYKSIAKQPHEVYQDGDDMKILLSKPIFFNPLQIFVPEGTAYGRPHEPFAGNSILLHIRQNEYIYIGESIKRFKTTDKILEYYSDVGNSDVPYPYAVGAKFIYFMLESVKMPLADIKEHILEPDEDPYQIMYDMPKRYIDSHKYKTKTIIPRPGW